MFSRSKLTEPVRGQQLQPLDEIGGFLVRPGFYKTSGATQGRGGVSFTISSHYATGCTVLVFQ